MQSSFALLSWKIRNISFRKNYPPACWYAFHTSKASGQAGLRIIAVKKIVSNGVARISRFSFQRPTFGTDSPYNYC